MINWQDPQQPPAPGLSVPQTPAMPGAMPPPAPAMAPGMSQGSLPAPLVPPGPPQQPGLPQQAPMQPQPQGLVPRNEEEITSLVESGALSPQTGARLLQGNRDLAQASTDLQQTHERAVKRVAGAQQRVAGEVQRAGEQRMAREADIYSSLRDAETEQQGNAVRIQREYEADQQEVTQRISELEEDLGKQQIDPSRALRGWRGVAGTVAIALGELSRAFGGGGPNIGLTMVNQAIDRDIATQKMARLSTKEQLAGKRNEYQLNRQNWQDERAAIEATRASAWRSVETQSKLLAAQTRNQDTKLRAADMAAQAGERAAESVLKAGQYELNYKLQLRQLSSQQKSAMAQQDKSWQDQIRHRQRLAKSGMTGEPLFEGADKLAGKVKIDSEQLQSKIDRLRKYVLDPEKGVGTQFWSSAAAKKASGMVTDIHLKLKDNKNLGVLAGPDMGMLEKLIGTDPTQLRSSVVANQLDSLQQSLQEDTNIALKNYGYELIPGSSSLAKKSYEEPVGRQSGAAQ